jgi:hypothetical protein
MGILVQNYGQICIRDWGKWKGSSAQGEVPANESFVLDGRTVEEKSTCYLIQRSQTHRWMAEETCIGKWKMSIGCAKKMENKKEVVFEKKGNDD